MYDLIEMYRRYTGHADLPGEAVDGLVGEDPPAGWRVRATADQRHKNVTSGGVY
jgi:hypothetical protein